MVNDPEIGRIKTDDWGNTNSVIEIRFLKEVLTMKENNHVVSEQEIRNIHSMDDPAAKKLAGEAEEGVNQFYHTIGTMGGLAVRDKYANMSSMDKIK